MKIVVKTSNLLFQLRMICWQLKTCSFPPGAVWRGVMVGFFVRKPSRVLLRIALLLCSVSNSKENQCYHWRRILNSLCFTAGNAFATLRITSSILQMSLSVVCLSVYQFVLITLKKSYNVISLLHCLVYEIGGDDGDVTNSYEWQWLITSNITIQNFKCGLF